MTNFIKILFALTVTNLPLVFSGQGISNTFFGNKENHSKPDFTEEVYTFKNNIIEELDGKLAFHQLPQVMRKVCDFVLELQGIEGKTQPEISRILMELIIYETDTPWACDIISAEVMNTFVACLVHIFLEEKSIDSYVDIYHESFVQMNWTPEEFAKELLGRVSDSSIEVEDLVFLIRGAFFFGNHYSFDAEEKENSIRLVLNALLSELYERNSIITNVPIQVLENLSYLVVELLV